MRFMVFVIPNKEDYLAGKMPPDELFAAMTDYNEQLIKAGIMLGGDGLTPPTKGARIEFPGGKGKLVDGLFIYSGGRSTFRARYSKPDSRLERTS